MRWDTTIKGYLEISLWGEEPERVINMALVRGIHLWDIRQEEKGCYLLKVRLGGYKALRHLVRRCDSHMRIVKKRGMPFYIMRANKRRVLVLGMLCFCAILYFLGSFVWNIEITGNEHVDTQLIMEYLDKQGVRIGAPKASFDRDLVVEHLLTDIPELAWAGMNIRGSSVKLEVSEKTLIPLDFQSGPADIVAARDGKIVELLVLKGTPLVQEGDQVYKGQILVSKLVYPQIQMNEDGSISPGGEPTEVRAKALVRARVERQQIAECPLREEVDRDTGRKTEVVVWRYKGWEMVVKGPRDVPYEFYRTVSQCETILPGRIPEGLVEIVSIIYIEQSHETHEWGLEGAYREAVKRARKEVMKTLPSDYRIITEIHEPVPVERADLIRVSYLIETVEDIGSYRYNK
jgi:similar to stage IV sporulation protein